MDKKKTIYREYFPKYMGHIPVKNEVIGMTVGATNEYIYELLNKEPPNDERLVPSAQDDYNYYNKAYFHENLCKDYKLEEDQIYSNNSKDARTWIGGSKYNIYPQHIPGMFYYNN
jgi:6-phosphogluconolactonase/glucosamine-6-phosphate isomerase/deaminase